jgi:hypothetical protein
MMLVSARSFRVLRSDPRNVCLPFGRQAVLIWRREENRGHHQALQNRAGERSINGGRRRRNDFE